MLTLKSTDERRIMGLLSKYIQVPEMRERYDSNIIILYITYIYIYIFTYVFSFRFSFLEFSRLRFKTFQPAYILPPLPP